MDIDGRAMMKAMKRSRWRGAALSRCKRYRYLLWRGLGMHNGWEGDLGPAVFVMLNPSTADGDSDDPTIRRCAGFAKRFGAMGFVVANLFAWRATDPTDLSIGDLVPDPVGDCNDRAIVTAVVQSQLGWERPGPVICAWGARGDLFGRARQVVGLIQGLRVPLHCLGVTKGGHPRHPLYVPGDTALQAFGEAR